MQSNHERGQPLAGSGRGAPGPKLEAGFRPLQPLQAESRMSPDVKEEEKPPSLAFGPWA